MSDDERSPDGTPILRHVSQHEGLEAPTEAPGLIQAMEAHMERCVGPSAGVFHELLSHLVHLDVHQLPPQRRSALLGGLHHGHERPAHDGAAGLPRG